MIALVPGLSKKPVRSCPPSAKRGGKYVPTTTWTEGSSPRKRPSASMLGMATRKQGRVNPSPSHRPDAPVANAVFGSSLKGPIRVWNALPLVYLDRDERKKKTAAHHCATLDLDYVEICSSSDTKGYHNFVRNLVENWVVSHCLLHCKIRVC